MSDSGESRPVIGHVTDTDGTVVVLSPDGSKRILEAGDPVYLHDQVITESSGSASIMLLNNEVIEVGGQSRLVLVEQLLHTPEAIEDPSQEVEDIQAAIAEGADPAEVTEPTAAGESDSSSDSSTAPTPQNIGEATVIERENSDTEVENLFEELDSQSEQSGTSSTLLDDDENGVIDINFAPTAQNMITGSAADGSVLEGQLKVFDANTGDQMTFSLLTPPASGTLTLNSDGSFRFIPGTDFEYLGAGESQTVTFVFEVSDSQGASSQASVDITIDGVNDTPEVSGPVSAAIEQNDAEITVDLLSQASDKDVTDTLSVTSLRLVEGNEAGISISLDSSQLVIDPEAYRFLAEGESETITYEYRVTDSQGDYTLQTASITLSGSNDTPQVSEAIIQTADQNSDEINIDLLQGASDIDASDTLNVVSLRLTAGNPVGVTVADDGNSLSVDPDAYNHLAEGESETIEYAYEVDDGKGGSVSQTASVTIEGENDAPEDIQLSGTELDENSSGAVVGSLSTSDIDTSDTHTYEVDDSRFEVVDGNLKLKDSESLNHEAEDSVDINVTTTDNNGASYSESFSITVNDINEAPTSANNSATIDEDTLYRFSLTDFPYNDVDEGDQLEAILIDSLPAKGSLELNGSPVSQDQSISRSDIEAGNLTFLPDAHESADDYTSFQFRVNDGELSSSAQTFSFDVTPIADTASLELSGTGVVSTSAISYSINSDEDTSIPLDLSSVLTDTDGSEAFQLLLSGAPAGSVLTDGSNTVTADGSDIDISSWQQNTLSLTPPVNRDTDFTLNFTATTTETANNDQASITKSLQVNLIPVDDAPVADSIDLNSVLEDNDFVITEAALLASASDVDGDTLSISSLTLADSGAGSLTDNGNGSWTYSPTENFFGEDVTFNFVVSDGTSGDEATASATLDVLSVNDAPVVTGMIDESRTEDTGTQSIDLLQGASDPDTGDTLSITQLRLISGDDSGVTPTSNTLEIDTTAYQHLAEGATETLNYVYTITDGNGGDLPQFATVTITGTNDAAIIAGVDVGTAQEDASSTLTTSGTLTITDADDNESEFVAETLVGSHGQLTIDAAGSWQYSADNSQSSIQELGHGESLEDSFTVESLDGTEHTVTARIQGTNDAPILTAGGTLDYTENDGSQVIDAHITLADIDSVTIDSATISISGNYASSEDNLSFSDHNGITGSWNASTGTLTLSGTATVAQYQEALRTVTYSNSSEAPDTSNRTISFSVDDGHDSSNIATSTITVTAVNDAPETQSSVVSSDEDTPYIFSTDDFTFSDADGHTLQSLEITALPEEGQLLYNGSPATVGLEVSRVDLLSGRLRFEPAPDESGNLYASFDFKVSDGELYSDAATFSFNIEAVNDNPVVTGSISQAGIEDTSVFQVDLLQGASDVDTGDTLTISNLTLTSGNNVGLSINGNNLSVDPDAYDYLPDGQTETIVYSYDIIDGNGGSASQTATIVITGTNDSAQITGIDTASVSEDSASTLTASGSLTVTDLDSGEAVFNAETLTGSYGDLVINSSGNWTYSADNSLLAIQGLDDGETLDESFTVTSAEGTTHTVAITIQGTNDAPVVDAGVTDQTATEEEAFSFQLPADAFSDIDGDSLTYSATLNDGSPLPAWVSFNPSTATFSGTPDDADTGQIVVRVTASDGDQTASGQFKINVAAVNDPPELQESPLVENIITALDFNAGAGLTVSDSSGEGNDAQLSGNANWVTGHDNSGSAFNLDGNEGSAELQGISTGGAMTISAWVKFDSFDQYWSRILDFGNGEGSHNIVLGHTGSNNGVGFHIYSGDADDPKGTLEINNFFVAEEWVHITATVESDGTMSLYKNGELAGQVDGVVPVEMVRTGNYLGKSHWSGDGYMDGSIDELIIANGAVNADQAKAIYQADSVSNLQADGFHVEEHSASGTVLGSVSATDVDNPSLSYSLTNDAGGRFTIDSNTGEISVATSDNTLLDHETTESFNITVQVSDGALTDSRSYTIYVTDTNDAPEAEDQSISTLEDSAYTFTISDFGFTDADEGDALSQVRIETLPVNGELLLNGSAVSLNDTVSQSDISSGLLTFRPELNANGDSYDSFNFSVADQQGTFSSSQSMMTVNVTAVNDAPTVSAGISHTVNEDHTITLTEAQLLANASDIDGDTLSVSNVIVDNGSVGVTNNGNGTWTITPVVHWSGTSQLSFDVSDGSESITNVLTLSVTPDADTPELLFNNSAQNATVTINEDTSIPLNLNAVVTDSDGSETLNILVEGIPAGAEVTDGSEIITSDGSPINVTSWNLNNLSVTPAEHHETDFTITVTATATEQVGGDTASTVREILIDIQPQNDSAIITGVNTGSVTEDDFSTTGPLGEQELIATGDLDIQEHDAGEASFQAETITGSYGELTINSSGQWEYIADSRQSEIQELGVTETLEDTITVQSLDGTTHDITITIQGANDQGDGAPVFLGSLAEDNTLIINESSILNAVTDIDGDTLTVSAIQLPVGGHSIVNNNDGTWTLTPAQDFNGMLEMLYVVSDGTQGFEVNNLVRVNITAVADTAVISGDDTATLAEDAAATLTATGSLSVTDPDAGEAGFTAETITGSYGTLTIDGDGNWSYSTNNSQTAIQSLGDSDSLQETLTVQSLDGTEHDITITFTGTNDGPVLDTAIADQSVGEDSAFNFQIPANTFSDEEGDALTYSATMADGSALPSWLGFDTSSRTFFGTPDNEDVGSLSLKVTATTPDGSSVESTFNLDITNINDAPVQVFQESGGLLVFEAENFHTSVSRSGETWTTVSKTGASEGEVVTTADGSSAYQGSTEGNSAELTYEIQVDTPGTYYVWVKGFAADGNADSLHLGLDGQYLNSSDAITGFSSGGSWSKNTMDSSTASIEITEAGRHQINLWVREDGFQADKIILTTDSNFVPSGNGPDESAYLNAPANQNATEDTAFSYTVPESAFDDVDAGDSLSWSATLSDGNPLPDWLNFNSATRTFSGTPENSDVGSLNIRITVDDGDATASTDISLTVANVNDAAVITGVDTGSVTEDDAATLTASGKLDITDVDTGEASFTAANFVGDYGTLAIDSDGNWSYSADNSQAPVQQLGEGDSLTETFTVDSVDGTTKDITITLNGSNDAPTVSSAIDLGNIDEDDSLTITETQLLASSSDVDGDSLAISSLTLADSNHGSVTDNGNGTWTFTPAANFNGNDISFHFVVSDGHSGGDTNGTAVVDVTALADSPVISPDTSETVVSSWGFEDTVISSDWQDVNSSPDGWSSAAGVFEFQRNGADSNTAFEGNQWLELDTDQTLDAISYQADTSDGQPLILEFATKERRADTTDTFEVHWNGELITTISPTDSWTVHRIELPPTGENQTSLEIKETSGSNDYEGSLLDDLKVLKVGITASDDPAYDFSITSLEDTSIPLNLGTITSGGTESIAASLAGIPAGSVLTDGSNTVNADGSNIDVSGWNLTALSLTPPAHSHTDFTITISATATEGNGDSATSSSSLRVELLAENDSPTAISLDSLAVSENSAGAVVGNLSTSDVDSGDSHSYTVNDSRFEVVNGLLKLKDGISLNHETEDSISLNVTTEDSEGETHTESFTLSVADTNDAPVTTGATSHSVNEDNSLTITKAELLANTTDADGNSLSVSNVQVASGQVSVTDNGNDTWTITPSAEWSGNGQLSFDISDGTVTVAGQADVTVTAVADTPDISVTGTTVISSMDFNGGLASGWTSENSAEIHSNGGPVGSSHTGTNVAELDNEGTGNPDAYYYSVDTSQGHDHQISLWVKQRDSYDGTDEIEIVWNGQVLQTIDPGTSWEEVTINLPDTDQASTQLAVREVAGQNNGVGPLLDQITISRLGADDSTDPAYDKMISSQEDTRIALDLGSSLNDSDGSETLSVSLSGIPAGFALTDGTNSLTTDGSAVDASSWNLSNLTITPIANYDTDFTITVTSTATEASNNDSATHTQTIRVDMQPVSDAAVITGDDSGSVTEDAAATLSTSGSLSVSDVDGSASFVAETVNGSYGSLIISADGNWTYSADNSQSSIQSLDDGEQLTDTIIIRSNDGTTHNVDITIQGTNDAPSLGATQTVTTNEDTSFTLTEAELLSEVSATDVDGETLSVSNVSISSGSISVADNGNGTWTFTPDANWSGSGEISLDVSDGTATVSGQVNVTVTPDADAPVISPSGSQLITSMDFENDDIATGWSSENTPEINQASVYGVTDASGGNGYIMDLDDTEGSAASTPDAIRYTLDTSSGFDHELTFKARTRPDSHGTDDMEVVWNGEVIQTVSPASDWETITIRLPALSASSGVLELRELSASSENDDHGILLDDVAIQKLTTISATEDTAFEFDLSATLADNDGSETLSVSLTGIPSGYTLSDGSNSVVASGPGIDISGWNLSSLTLTPESNANTDFTMTLSATATETSGGDSSTVTQAIQVEIQAINDTAVISGDNTGAVVEDAAATLSASGSLNVTDVDTGEASFTAETINGTYGSLTIDANGDWTYSADNSQSAIQSLGSSQALNLDSDWNSSARINSDLVTSDDFTVSLWVKPDTVDGSYHGFFGSQTSDVSDRSPSLWVAADGGLHWSSMASTGGSFSGLASNVFTQGEWSHITWVKEGTEYRFYKDGELIHTDTAPEHVQLSGYTELGRVDNSLDGQLDDLQTYSRALTPSEIADAMNGDPQSDLLSHYDFAGANLTEALSDKSGNLATGTSNGSLDDADLVAGRADTLTETITVQSQDGTTYNITITLTGDNDAPIAATSNSVNLDLNEDSSLVITEAQLLARVTDIDDSHLSLSDVSLVSGQASLVDNNDGTWTLTPDANWSGAGAISFKVSDGHSVTTIQTGFDVASVNDAPLLANAITAQSVDEDSPFSFTVPENTFSHADGDTLTFTATQADGSALPEWLNFNASTRVFSGTPDNGDVATLNLKVTATDEDGETVDASFNLVVNNINDAPSPVFAESGGLVSIEAEHFSSQVNRSGNAWTVENDASASGDQQVNTSNNDADGFNTDYTGISSELTYDIQFESAGTYYVWVRADAPDTRSDSVHIGLNGEAVSTGSRISFNSGSHDWAGDRMDNAGRITIEVDAPGVHQLNLWMREDGTAVDKIVISDDVNYVPSGSGPAESDYVGFSDQTATEESAFSYTIDANAFNDLDGDNLTYSATLANGDPLPAWVSFDAGTRTFSGTPDDPDLGVIQVRVTASDGSLSSSADVSITVTGVNDAPTEPAAVVEQIDFVWGGTSITDKNAASLNMPDGFQLGDSVWLTKADGGYGKGVKVQISDNQDGTLNFKIIEAKYTDLTTWNSLSDEQKATYFETAGTEQTVATSNSDAGYGISNIAVNGGSAVSGFLDTSTGKNVDPFSSIENSSNGTVVGSITATDADGDNLVYSLSDDAGGRFAIDSSTGQVTVADGSLLDYEAASSHTITVQVSDGQVTSEQSYSIQLSDTNDAPELTGTIDDQTTAEESVFSYTLPANAFSDDDGDSLTYSASLANGDPLPAWLTFDAGTRTFSGTPDDPDVGSLSVKISVTDGMETTDVFWSVTVTAVNDGPEPVSDTSTDQASVEGSAVTGAASVLANDSDAENDPLTVTDANGTSVSGSTTITGDYGDLTISEDGNWTYTPISLDLSSNLIAHWTFDEGSGTTAADSSSVDSYSDDGILKEGATFVSGGLNGSAVQFDGASAIIDLTDSSELNTYSGHKTERTIDFSFKIDADNDLSGRQVLYEEGGGGKGYNIYIDNGTLYVGAWANENGWDNGTFLTKDISSISSADWQQVSLVLDSDNNSLKAYLNGEEFASGHAEAMGHHGDEAAFGSVSLHYNESSGETLRGGARFHDGSVDIPDDHFGFDGLIDEARIYDRALNDQEIKALGYEFKEGILQDTFTYTVSDGSETATSTLTIDVNRAPEALSGTLSATEDGGAIVGQLSAIDFDTGESLTYSVETQPSEGSVTVNADGSYSFNPGSDFQDLAQGTTRDVTFDYRVTDSQGDSSTNTITVTVTGTNDAASITSVETYSEDFNDFTAGDLNGQQGWVTEKFNSALDLTLTNVGEDGSQALQFNQVSASAAGSLLNTVPDLSNASTFTFEADIAKNWWGTDFGIGGDNNSDGKIGKNDNELAISIKPADHNDTLTLQLADGSTQTVSFSPADGNGWARFRIEVDLEANSGSGAVTVKYKDLSAGESDWTTVSGLSGINAQLNPSASDHTNPENWNGIYINGDGQGVRVDNLMLEARSDTTSMTLTEDSGVDGSGNLVKSGLLIASDTDSGENNFTAETLSGSYGSLTIDTAGNWTYTASNSQTAIQGLDDGETLTDTITVQTADGTTHDVSIVINGINDGPVAANVDLGSSNEDTDLVITEAQLLANSTDVDGDNLSITTLTLDNGSHGSLTDNGDGTWTFSPAENFNGTDISFSFTVSDGTAQSSATATVDVAAVNDAPELSAHSLISGIEAAYNFSNTTDTSGNGNDLTMSGSATLGTGHNGSGQAFEMDGTSGGGEISGLEIGGAMSISAWVKYDSLSQSWSRIVDFGDSDANNNIVLAHVGTSSELAFEIYDGAGTPADGVLRISNFFTEGEWVHVTATVDGTGAMRVYKNGELAGENLSGAVPPEIVRTGNYVGQSHWNDGHLDGSIDELTVFNSALTAEQIKAVYQADSVDNLLSDAFHVVENSANSTVLGSVAATDIDTASNSLTYSLSNDAGGRFTINSTTGEISVADNGQLDHESNASHTITVQVSDGELSSTRDYTVYVTNINEAPTAADNTLTTNEDSSYTLTLSDLGYSDQEGVALSQIQISTLPAEGTLKLNGSAVTADQVISKADIDAGLLTFEPDTHEAGDSYASVGFKVHDGNSYSGEYNLTFNVTPVSDGVTMNNISTQVLNSTFDGNNADGWQRTNPYNTSSPLVQNNQLYNWNSTESYRSIDTSDSSVQTYELTFTLHHVRNPYHTSNVWVKWNGQTVATYTEGAGSGTNTSTKTILLTATGDPTTELRFDQDTNYFRLDNIQINKVVETDEDTTLTLPDLGIGLVDTDGSETLSVSATGVPSGAVLTDGTNTLTSDGSALDISGWNFATLQITPPQDSTDNMDLTFTATATDSNGDTSSTSHTMSIRVNSVDDRPVSADNSLMLKQTDSYTFSSDDFSFTDGDAGDSLQSITITSLPASGSLTLNGSAVTANQVISASDINNLTYTAPATDPDVGTSFSFTVSDGGLSSDPQTFSLNVRGTYSENLLTNPSAQEGTSGWHIIQNGGSGWGIEGASHDGDGTSWGTSYDWARKSQTVDLLANGFTQEYLDSAPDISVSDWYRNDHSNDNYYLKVELRDASNNVIASLDTGTLTATGSWQEAGQVFSDYGPGVRYVYFEHGGEDTEHWGGQYGARIDDSEVVIKVGDVELKGSDNAEIIDGTEQADTIKGEGGNDTLLGDAGADIIFGGAGNDTIKGDDGQPVAINLDSSFVTAASQISLPAATGLKAEVFDTSTIFSHLDEAINLVNTSHKAKATFTASSFNYSQSGSSTLGDFLGSDSSSLTGNSDMSDQTFALKMTGYIRLSAGTHDFNVASDDGFRLKINGETVTEFTAPRGVATSSGNYTAPQDGLYEVELIYWQGNGGADLDITSSTAEPFQFYEMLPAGAEQVSGQSYYDLPTPDITVDVASGVALSAGTDNGDGTWTLKGIDLNGLTMTNTGINAWDDSLTFTSTKVTNRSIAIGDASFESQNLSDGGFIHNPGSSSWTFSGNNSNGIHNYNSSAMDEQAAEGDDAAFINDDGGTITQTLSENFDRNTTYELKIDIGNRKDFSGLADYEVRIKAGGITLSSDGSVSPAEGQFETLTLNLNGSNIAADSAAIGQPLVIELYKASGPQIAFDNVRLTATTTEQIGQETVNTDQSDQITGGAGDDTLTGGNDSDTFIWQAADAGTAETPAVDIITDFHIGQGGDVLDLSDILVDEQNHQLDEYLHFNFDNGDTTLEITPEAGGSVTQKVTFQGLDLSTLGGTDSEIISNLLNGGNLQVDQ